MAEFSADESKALLDAFKSLGVRPKADDATALKAWMRDYLISQGDITDTQAEPHPKEDPRSHPDLSGHHQDPRYNVIKSEPRESSMVTHTQVTTFPKLVQFSGDSTKTDAVTFDMWHYDVQCLLEENLHPPESIKQAIRNSLRGEAGRIIMRLGPKSSIVNILSKLACVYGTVELGENLLSEFYSVHQRPNEDVSTWSCRLEDLLAKARSRGQVQDSAVDEMLRTKFWTGLTQKFKDSSRHKFDTIKDFDRLRVEIRAIEHEHRLSEARTSCTKPTPQAKMSQPPLDVQDTLAQLCNQMKDLQKGMEELKKGHSKPEPPRREETSHQNYGGQDVPSYGQPHTHVTDGQRNQGYEGQRPPRTRNECYRCHRRGHMARDCHARTDVTGCPLND